jgi:hypothetical protein
VIRVILPAHLRTLARLSGEVALEVKAPATLGRLLDALEAAYPVLEGTVRDHTSKERRAFLRYFACKQDLSLEGADHPLPEPVVRGEEPFRIVGALAGG